MNAFRCTRWSCSHPLRRRGASPRVFRSGSVFLPVALPFDTYLTVPSCRMSMDSPYFPGPAGAAECPDGRRGIGSGTRGDGCRRQEATGGAHRKIKNTAYHVEHFHDYRRTGGQHWAVYGGAIIKISSLAPRAAPGMFCGGGGCCRVAKPRFGEPRWDSLCFDSSRIGGS
jgi:hypothetical protein